MKIVTIVTTGCWPANRRPVGRELNDDADMPVLKVLPVTQDLVGRDQNVVLLAFHQVDQRAGGIIRPAFLRQPVRRLDENMVT